MSNLTSDLNHYKTLIEKKIREELSTFDDTNRLKQAIEYSLTTNGKRFRPILVYMVANALGKGADVSYAALSVEYSHTASLIIDDLPCIDDDDFRRNQPSLHKAFEESTALLASYALVSAGYECLAKNAQVIAASSLPFSGDSDKICRLALENVTYNAGFSRLINGQYLDLFPPDATEQTLRAIVLKKTVSLFEISFVLGWLYGGGNLNQLDDIKKAAEHFGMAFQIADDFGDVEQDIQNNRSINAVSILGFDRAKALFHVEIKAYREIISRLNWNPQELLAVADLLELQASPYFL